MKKIFVIISALFALVACNKEIDIANNEINKTLDEQSQEIKVNLSINRTDAYTDTKATVKTGWVNGDVIFVFFKGIAAPKYLEMRYDGTEWTATSMNSLTVGDLLGAADKKMTAIYLPYGSTATVANDEGNFIFSDLTYSGYFLQAELASYTYDTELKGRLNMTAPAPATDGDKHIHFDITGYTSSHAYYLSQDYVKPITFSRVSSDGIVSHAEGSMGDFIAGYHDSNNSIISFSGILDASAVGSAKDYTFSIQDDTFGITYTRDVGVKILSEAKYIGIGDISDGDKWGVNKYVDLGLSVMWATCNMGATTPIEAGDYYAWGEIESKATFTQDNYKWGNGYESYGEQFTKYVNDEKHGVVDNLTSLQSADDAALVELGPHWRMPTYNELNELLTNCQFEIITVDTHNVYKVTGPSGHFIIIPLTGGYMGSTLYSTECATFLTSTLVAATYPGDSLGDGSSWGLQYKEGDDNHYGWFARSSGIPIRPVYSEQRDYQSHLNLSAMI